MDLAIQCRDSGRLTRKPWNEKVTSAWLPFTHVSQLYFYCLTTVDAFDGMSCDAQVHMLRMMPPLNHGEGHVAINCRVRIINCIRFKNAFLRNCASLISQAAVSEKCTRKIRSQNSSKDIWDVVIVQGGPTELNSIMYLIDLFLLHLSNIIWNTSIFDVKSSWASLYTVKSNEAKTTVRPKVP